MTPGAVKGLLNDALELPASKREAFLRAACDGRDELLRELLDLLVWHERANGFLEPWSGGASLLDKLASAPIAPGAAPDFTGVLFAGRYRAERPCGRGGFGSVYEGVDLLTESRVAIKVVLGDPGEDSDWLQRELAALRRLDVPGVVRLLDDGVAGPFPFEDGTSRTLPFLVMPLVQGSHFPGTPLPAQWPKIAQTVVSFLEALSQIHAAGIVHGDIKPDNVLVDGNGRPTIIDLGISAGAAVTDLTDVRVGGALPFIAPERLRSAPPDAAADLYSAGVMLYLSLTGATPYDGPAGMQIESLCAGRPAVPAAERGAELPAEVAAVIDELVQPDPARRPRSASATAARLAGRLPPPESLRRKIDALPPGPLTEEALRSLFAGPERIFRLATDAARRLHAITGGDRTRVVLELQRWLRSGVAQMQMGKVSVRRSDLDSMRVAENPVDPSETVDACCARALEALEDGDVGRAGAIIELRLAEERDRQGGTGAAVRLLTVLLRTALCAGTERWLDLALYHIGRIRERSDELDRLEKLTRAAKLSFGRDTDRALALADALGPLDDVDLESIRQSARLMAARNGKTNRTAQIVPSVEAWAREQRSARVRYQLLIARAWEAAAACDYERATELACEGLEHADSRRLGTLGLLTVGMFALEAHRLDVVRASAEEALEMAYDARHAQYAVRAESLLRCAAYRADAMGEPDLELVDALALLRVPNIEGIVAFTEGAAAWRCGDTALAREFALFAESCFRRIGQGGGALLARCLATVAGHELSPDEVRTITGKIRDCPDTNTRFQAAGLLAGVVGAEQRAPLAEIVRAAAASTPAAHRPMRRDVISLAEALERCESTPPTAATGT